MKLQIFRYYLSAAQPMLQSQKASYSRKEAMDEILLEKIDFESTSHAYSYRLRAKFGESFYWSKIGKKTLIEHELKENDDFVKRREEEWPHRIVILDTNPDVQIVAFEIHQSNLFGSAVLVLKYFEQELNNRLQEYGWQISFEPITETETFWKIIDENIGSIKSIKFLYYVPNIFGIHDKLTQELTDAKNNFGAQKVETEFSNEQGNLVVPKTDFIKESVDHIRQGGGKYTITLKDSQVKYSSESEPKIAHIREAELHLDDEQATLDLLNRFFDTHS